jgi:hypothetical protein
MSLSSDKFTVANRVRILHRLLQGLLGLIFFAQLNYLAMRHYTRYDVTRNHFFSLSPETKAYLRALDQPVDFIVSIPRNSPQPDEQMLYEYTRSLLDQYQHVLQRSGRPGMLRVEWVDLFKDIMRARELAETDGFEQKNMILVRGPERSRTLSPTDLFEFEGLEARTFKGEQAFTSALLEVTSAERPVVYFTVGHGEMRLDDVDRTRGLSHLAAALNEKNFALGHLDLTQVPAVPADADLVVVADPQGPFLEAEQEKLRRFLSERAGRLALFLGPGQDAGLDALLEDWGLRADDMVIIEGGPNFVGSSGSFLIREYGMEHPLTSPLAKNEVFLVGGVMRPLRPDPGAPIDDRLRVQPVLFSSASSWGESGFRAGLEPRFDAASDLPGPVPVGSVAERRSASQLGIDIAGGRVLAVGVGDLLANRRLTASLGNQLLVFSSTNWLLERDQILALPPRPMEQYQINLSQGELQRLALYFLLVPAAVGALGLILVWMRKF